GMIIFLAFLLVSEISRMISYPGFIYSVRSVLRSGSSFSMFALPVAFAVSLVVLVSNIRLMQREGKSWRNMLACILGAMICIGSIAPMAMQEYLQWYATGIDVHNEGGAALYVTMAIECVATASITYLECILLSTVILGIKAARKVPAFDKDYMLILGCQIREDGTLTPLLKGRADRAIEFANMQKEKTGKDLIFVPSGGQGSDEVLSEADAIHNYLVGTGIPEERILVENQSVNTLENFRNSWRLIREREAGAQADPKIAFSTTNYHVFRSGILASEQGIPVEGIGSKTRSYFWINAFVREFIANLFAERKTHLKTIAVLIIMVIVMVLTVFYSVNR
ncbi:MAG: YdcF family protein, partial [Firmicutes bacterium]|nr:YdcF family protein [Bacillota bacterium]